MLPEMVAFSLFKEGGIMQEATPITEKEDAKIIQVVVPKECGSIKCDGKTLKIK